MNTKKEAWVIVSPPEKLKAAGLIGSRNCQWWSRPNCLHSPGAHDSHPSDQESSPQSETLEQSCHGASARAKATFTEKSIPTPFASPRPLDPGSTWVPGHLSVGEGLQWTHLWARLTVLTHFPYPGGVCFCPVSGILGIWLVLHCSVPAAIHCQHIYGVPNGCHRKLGPSP